MSNKHTLITDEQLMSGFKKAAQPIAYPSRKEDNHLTTLSIEIHVNSDVIKKSLKYVGKLQTCEFYNFIMSDYWMNQYVTIHKAKIKVIKVKYWKLTEEILSDYFINQ